MRYAAALALLLLAFPAHAQVFDLPGTQTAASIVVTPQNPEPGSEVTFTVTSPLLDIENALISWRINGELRAEERGLTSIRALMGPAGEPFDVSASIVGDDGTALASASIAPARVDLLWEADGLTPPFYRGRTLPAAGARLTLVALPTFIRDGERIDEKDLVFTWRRGARALGSLSGRGKSSIRIESPSLFGAETISVQVRTLDNTMTAFASSRIATERSPLRLYVDHPLFGLLFHRALPNTAAVREVESTFVAIPYFAPASSANDGTLTFEWRVNRDPIQVDGARPSSITINAAGSTGVAFIELTVGHVSNFFFSANDAWNTTLSTSAGDAAGNDGNPFGPRDI